MIYPYVVIAPIGLIAPGETYSADSFPLHVTVVPPFIARDKDQVEEIMASVASATSAFRVVGQSHAWFGPEADVQVTLISPEPSATIHSLAISKLAASGWAPIEPKYSGSGFLPHVTRTGIAEFTVGDCATLEKLALIEMTEPPTVRTIFPFQTT
jgi:2'-5' RNA ligase